MTVRLQRNDHGLAVSNQIEARVGFPVKRSNIRWKFPIKSWFGAETASDEAFGFRLQTLVVKIFRIMENVNRHLKIIVTRFCPPILRFPLNVDDRVTTPSSLGHLPYDWNVRMLFNRHFMDRGIHRCLKKKSCKQPLKRFCIKQLDNDIFDAAFLAIYRLLHALLSIRDFYHHHQSCSTSRSSEL